MAFIGKAEGQQRRRERIVAWAETLPLREFVDIQGLLGDLDEATARAERLRDVGDKLVAGAVAVQREYPPSGATLQALERAEMEWEAVRG